MKKQKKGIDGKKWFFVAGIGVTKTCGRNKTLGLRKTMDHHIPHEKCPFLEDMDFLVKQITYLAPNFM
jgi:hypothetical protein